MVEIVRRIYLTKKNKILAGSQTIATARIAPKICLGQPLSMYSQCSAFHPNPFTFGGGIVEGVNAFFCPVEYFHYSPEAKRGFGRITRKVGIVAKSFRT